MNKHPDCEDRCQILEHKGYHTCAQTGRCEQLEDLSTHPEGEPRIVTECRKNGDTPAAQCVAWGDAVAAENKQLKYKLALFEASRLALEDVRAENSRLRGEITRLESSHADLNKDYIALEQSYADLSAERQLSSGRVVPEKVLWDAIAALERSEHHVTGKQKSDAAMALGLATAPKEDRHGR